MLQPSAQDSLGYVLIGVVISIFLYGIITLQAFIYFRHYPHDRLVMKLFIAVLVFVDTLHSAFSVAFLYDKLIIHFNDSSSLLTSTWLFETYPALVGIISTSVQLFFAWRVKVLTENAWLFSVIVFLALPQIVGGLVYAVEAGRVKEFSRFVEFKPLIITWLSLSAVCDITITTVLTCILRKHRNKKLVATQDIVKRIMNLTLQNGLLTTIWILADLITALASNNGAHFIFCYPLAKLYINSLISTLNARPVERPDSMYRTTLLRPSTGYSHIMTSHSREGSRDSSMTTKAVNFALDGSLLPVRPDSSDRYSTMAANSHHGNWDDNAHLTEKLLPAEP